jgi:uncharacterized protein
MRMIVTKRFCATLAVAVGSVLLLGANEDRQSEGTILRITGVGEVQSTSTIAVMQVGINSFSTSASRAMADNARSMASLRRSLGRLGIEERDVSTRHFQVGEHCEREERQSDCTQGFQVVQNLVITFRDIDDVGPSLDALVDAGATQMHGPQFHIDPAPELEQRARAQAVREANARAQEYARAFGLRVARIITITGGNTSVSDYERPMARAVAAGPSTQVDATQQTISASVAVEYELTR